MRIEKASGKDERRILTGMIVDQSVCARIASKWKPDLFRSRWANIVGELCVEYLNSFGAAPGKAVEGLFDAWATKQQDKDTVALVEKFLGSLSGEYEVTKKEINAPYLIDLSANYFNRVKLQRLFERGLGELDRGKVDDALQSVLEFGRIEMGKGSTVDVYNDEAAIANAFEERQEPLFTLPGAIGKFFGRSLVREGFISFLAPEKRGKTTWLVWLAKQAVEQRKRVAFFAVGDESEADMILRFAVLHARRPMERCSALIPTFLEVNGEEVDIRHQKRFCKNPLTFQKTIRAFNEFKRETLKSKREWLRLSVHPNSTLSIRGMDEQLKQWERDGWVPDLIVVDYMDIMDDSGRDDKRHRIDALWRGMRAMAQKWHALIVTASQADSEGATTKTLGLGNFSEDKRKRAHVTGEVGINQTDTEKDQGIFRLNWIVRRGARYVSKRCCYAAGCMEIQNPCMFSAYPKWTEKPRPEQE